MILFRAAAETVRGTWRAAFAILDAVSDERRWSKRFDWKGHRGH